MIFCRFFLPGSRPQGVGLDPLPGPEIPADGYKFGILTYVAVSQKLLERQNVHIACLIH